MTNQINSASEIYKSKRRMLLKLEKQHLRDLKRRPPIEIIIKIMSYLDNPMDIKNCMMINKETRSSIFNKQEFMRHFEFNLDSMLYDWRHGIEFLQDRGKGIRNFRYGLFIGSRPLMRLVLNQMPNLEELRFEKRKCEDVKVKKDVVDDEFDGCNDGEDEDNEGSDQNGLTGLKRKKSGENGRLEGNNGEFGTKIGENGGFGIKKGETGAKSGKNCEFETKSDQNCEIEENGEFPNKTHENPGTLTTQDPNPTDPDNLSDTDNGFNSDLETEDDNDSDDDSYKDSIQSSDDNESSIDNESIGEVEIRSDESSDEFTSDDEDLESVKEPAKLSKLTFLKINLEDLIDFVDNTQDVKALEKLSVTLSEFENEEVLVNFLNDQVNLKELEIVKHKRLKELNLPKTQNPKFNIKLKKLKVKLDCRNYEKLANFMSSQVSSLKELEISIGLYRNTQHFTNFFQNANNLTTLTLREGLGKFVRDLNDFRLENLKYFDQKNQSIDLDTVYAVFPNLETLKCFATSTASVTYPKLTTLELKIINFGNARLINLPNMRNFAVTMNIKNVNDENWTEFARKHQNIENLIIQSYDFEFSIGQSQELKSLCILENLRLLPKLQNVSYKTTAMPRRISEFQSATVDAEQVKVDINVEKKVAKVSQFLVQRHKGSLVKLLNDFEGFKFFEVRDDEMKKIRIDAEMFAGIDEPSGKRQKVSD